MKSIGEGAFPYWRQEVRQWKPDGTLFSAHGEVKNRIPSATQPECQSCLRCGPSS